MIKKEIVKNALIYFVNNTDKESRIQLKAALALCSEKQLLKIILRATTETHHVLRSRKKGREPQSYPSAFCIFAENLFLSISEALLHHTYPSSVLDNLKNVLFHACVIGTYSFEPFSPDKMHRISKTNTQVIKTC